MLDLLAEQSSQEAQSLSSERESKLSWLVSSPHPLFFFYRGCSCNTKPESFSRFWPNPVGLPKLWKHLRVSKSQWILSDGTWWVLDQGSASLEAGKPTRLFCSRHRLSFSLPTPHQKHGEKISPGWKNISIIPCSSSLCCGTLSGLRDLLAD